jgi:hypothetical protein
LISNNQVSEVDMNSEKSAVLDPHSFHTLVRVPFHISSSNPRLYHLDKKITTRTRFGSQVYNSLL